MTQPERRKYPRLSPQGMKATITLDPIHNIAETIEGDVVDISFTGIKIRLRTPIAGNMAGPIRIELVLPDTGIPFFIAGVLKHQDSPTELGLHYIDSPNVVDLDKFMFECVKLIDN